MENDVKKLQEEFIKNSEKMVKELKKGADIVIKKNKTSYNFYIHLIKKM